MQVKYVFKIKCCLGVLYLKMCDNSQGKSFSLWCANNKCSFYFIICHVFGDGNYSKSFLIPWQDWFSSTIKWTKNLQSDASAWWAKWVWSPHQSSFLIWLLGDASHQTARSSLKSWRARLCSLLVSQAGSGYRDSCFNVLISPTTKQLVIPQNQEPRHFNFNFSCVTDKLSSRSTVLSPLPLAEKNAQPIWTSKQRQRNKHNTLPK